MADFGGISTHEGQFVEYDILGNIFEVSSKYKPPILPVGSGAYGVVCSFLNSETNEMVAIKKISDAFDSYTNAKCTLREIMLLRHLDHQNVISIRDVIPPPERRAFSDVYIATELMDTDLHQIIRSKQGLSEEHCQVISIRDVIPPPERRAFSDVYIATELMDTDLHQIIRSKQGLSEEHCQICDFGLARATSENEFMTEYVVTRWYRAPELLLNSAEYTAAIDVWSVGCIFMEMINKKPLFPGKDHVHQMRLLTELLGTPRESELGFVRNESARRYIKQLQQRPRRSLARVFPHVHPEAIDLVEKMLTFDPTKRITVEEALAHPYLAMLHNKDDEQICAKPFSFQFEKQALLEEEMKEMIYRESLSFNPEYAYCNLPDDKTKAGAVLSELLLPTKHACKNPITD
ncbi:Mitogen-activated protein kinase [Thalictrum thalictroides]|uniref:Mitogen-activated protein kinase n=1 Tax=Thalictrum thalictroides TaxID=46969 RepID=A0A7J6W3U3_THATH|nr:Mitogen-activated protein kinase [Thalictrum thalictroides]